MKRIIHFTIRHKGEAPDYLTHVKGNIFRWDNIEQATPFTAQEGRHIRDLLDIKTVLEWI